MSERVTKFPGTDPAEYPEYLEQAEKVHTLLPEEGHSVADIARVLCAHHRGFSTRQISDFWLDSTNALPAVCTPEEEASIAVAEARIRAAEARIRAIEGAAVARTAEALADEMELSRRGDLG